MGRGLIEAMSAQVMLRASTLRFSAAWAAASLKRLDDRSRLADPAREVFRGMGRGLIEATIRRRVSASVPSWFSAAWAAASLKPAGARRGAGPQSEGFSAAWAAASLKRAGDRELVIRGVARFSAAWAAASLKRVWGGEFETDPKKGFPRHGPRPH